MENLSVFGRMIIKGRKCGLASSDKGQGKVV